MQTFSKQERLYSKKKINTLFVEGEKFCTSSFEVIWQQKELNIEFPAKIMISIPKKNIKNANERNLLKRLIRESYRKQKKKLYQVLLKQEKQIIFGIVYQKSDLTTYKDIEVEINFILDRLIKKNEATLE